eukprot:2431143-Rhodomonas_salina.1
MARRISAPHADIDPCGALCFPCRPGVRDRCLAIIDTVFTRSKGSQPIRVESGRGPGHQTWWDPGATPAQRGLLAMASTRASSHSTR